MQNNKGDETNEHVIAGCSSLPECAYVERHNQLANTFHQQIAIKYKLLDRNTPPHCTCKPQPVLKTANKVLYWDRSIITDTMVDISRPDSAPIDRQNKTVLVTDTAVPLAHNVPKTEEEKITKNENIALEIKKNWKINNISIYHLAISAERVVTKTC